jgi:phosphatidyl-myo-inositol dimannoside synthase
MREEGVLLLSPSHGLGGGIERYVETLESAFAVRGINCRRADLWGSGAAAHARLFARVRRQMQAGERPSRVIAAHRTLLPVASAIALQQGGCGISVICHGSDVWGTRFRIRSQVENYFLRRPDVRVVSASGFTAGTLFDRSPVTVLPPGLSRQWFDILVRAASESEARRSGTELVTAFRLGDWQDKGLPQILQAVAGLTLPGVRLVVCGSGLPSAELQQLVDRYPFCSLRCGLTDVELARQLASADVCVLATRTRFGRNACGEGFGLALLEAQVAGTAVIAPAYGGSHDAYLEGVTGSAPLDESSDALRMLLDEMLRYPDQLHQMSKNAAEWARQCFDPEKYASLVVSRLL